MKFSIKDFFIQCEQIRRKLRLWSHLLKKSLMGNFIFLRNVSCDKHTCQLCEICVVEYMLIQVLLNISL